MKTIVVLLVSLAFPLTLYGQDVGYLMKLTENKKCEVSSFRNHYTYEFRKFPDFKSAETYYKNFESSKRKDPSHRLLVSSVRKDQYFAVILVTQTYPNSCSSGQQFQLVELHTSNVSLADAKQKAGEMV
ncbi:hypothetical protein SAMN05192553_10745 [Cyclobacterium xiamenense]|uniref:Uncharacterized protein n=1 Tax=Cyclobacterium xiamenense TaxID=1297121 RepID=A0A1H7AIX2_9BACT|nr:hypothetical protein [Cyclobacterium xiamenense]SEJ64866.1 hypothetical protein SAMN05192553_10745 [Cyclobacterium xiamenense]